VGGTVYEIGLLIIGAKAIVTHYVAMVFVHWMSSVTMETTYPQMDVQIARFNSAGNVLKTY
jgi:hypothetical protein